LVPNVERGQWVKAEFNGSWLVVSYLLAVCFGLDSDDGDGIYEMIDVKWNDHSSVVIVVCGLSM